MEVDGAPDLTDFMNDWFFGTVGARHSGGGYDLTGESSKRPASPAGKKQEKSGGGGDGSSASRQTMEWLEEAKRMVGTGSQGRLGSPSRQVPRFAGGSGTEPTQTIDRRDPMSRSARRQIDWITNYSSSITHYASAAHLQWPAPWPVCE
jgi:hypothetical protein